MASAARLSRMVAAEDFRRAARRRLPRIFFDYIDGGASAEATLAANVADFGRYRLRPQVLRNVAVRRLDADFLGGRHALPLMLGPVGSLGLFRAGAEAASFRAARAAGIPACMSSFAITDPETLLPLAGSGGAFQLYVLKDRERTEAILDRIAACGAETLFVTVDTSVSGIRERDIRNGLRVLSRPGPRMIADFLAHPLWLADMVRVHPVRMALARDWPEAGRGYLAQAAFLAGQIDPSFDERGLAWLRSRWKGHLIVKGILTVKDARRCVDLGADGIVVSNHGGRQLDGVSSSVAALAEIGAALAGRAEILFDGGVRRGGDVVKALALGASACLLGRAYVYGAVAGGEAGVATVLAALRAEIDTTLALMGFASVDELRAAGTNALEVTTGVA